MTTAVTDKHQVTIHAVFDFVPDRDARFTIDVMKDGLAEGWNDNLDGLARYLAGRT